MFTLYFGFLSVGFSSVGVFTLSVFFFYFCAGFLRRNERTEDSYIGLADFFSGKVLKY